MLKLVVFQMENLLKILDCTTYPEAIYTKTAKGNTLYFFHDGKIGLVGQDNKVKLIPETFTCDEAIASFKTPEQKQKELSAQTSNAKNRT
jgi:hypothetical protein